MQIHQLNLQYNPEQDRLIFRINTLSKEELRFYFTRRFVKLLWPVLEKILQEDLREREPQKACISEDYLEFEKEMALSQTHSNKKYDQEIKDFPLGKEIVLLSKIQIKKTAQGQILCLLPSQGKGIEFPTNRYFIHMICKLLVDSVSKTDWNLPIGKEKHSARPIDQKAIH